MDSDPGNGCHARPACRWLRAGSHATAAAADPTATVTSAACTTATRAASACATAAAAAGITSGDAATGAVSAHIAAGTPESGEGGGREHHRDLGAGEEPQPARAIEEASCRTREGGIGDNPES